MTVIVNLLLCLTDERSLGVSIKVKGSMQVAVLSEVTGIPGLFHKGPTSFLALHLRANTSASPRDKQEDVGLRPLDMKTFESLLAWTQCSQLRKGHSRGRSVLHVPAWLGPGYLM